MPTKVENLWNTHKAISELIRFADTKATAILAVNGVLAGFYSSNIGLVQAVLEEHSIASIPLVSAIAFIILSTTFAAYCIAPRLGTKKGSLTFFHDIDGNYENAIDYEKALQKTTSGGFKTDLAHQIWAISKVASTKYRAVCLSISFFVAALFSGIAFVVVVLWW